MDDHQLLKSFAEAGSSEAFAELVRRHVDLVYSAARRQCREAALAEDVTQEVFVRLARYAATIRDREAIAGWLLTTTRRVALNAHRSAARRQRHEKERAHMDTSLRDPGEQEAWSAIEPHIDRAMSEISPADRDAITLRYMKSLSFEQVGKALGVPADTARKRVDRAIGRLRECLARAGVATSAEALGGSIAHGAVMVAPAKLVTEVTAAAVATPVLGGVTGGVLGGLKGALIAMALTKMQVVGSLLAAAVIALPVGYVVLRGTGQEAGSPVAVATAGGPAWVEPFEAKYQLGQGQNVKRVVPPFIDARVLFAQRQNAMDTKGEVMTALVMKSDGSELRFVGGSDKVMTLGGILQIAAEIWPQDTDLPKSMLLQEVPGDWVIREDAVTGDKVGDVCSALADALGARMVLRQEPMEREVIVVRGKLEMAGAVADAARISLYTTEIPDPSIHIGMAGEDPVEPFQFLGELTGKPVVIEADLGEKQPLLTHAHPSVDYRKRTDDIPAEDLRKALANLASQTSLQLTVERRTVPTWRLVPVP